MDKRAGRRNPAFISHLMQRYLLYALFRGFNNHFNRIHFFPVVTGKNNKAILLIFYMNIFVEEITQIKANVIP